MEALANFRAFIVASATSTVYFADGLVDVCLVVVVCCLAIETHHLSFFIDANRTTRKWLNEVWYTLMGIMVLICAPHIIGSVLVNVILKAFIAGGANTILSQLRDVALEMSVALAVDGVKKEAALASLREVATSPVKPGLPQRPCYKASRPPPIDTGIEAAEKLEQATERLKEGLKEFIGGWDQQKGNEGATERRRLPVVSESEDAFK